LLAAAKTPRSPLQRQIGRLTLQLGAAAVLLCGVVFGATFLQTREWAQAILAAVSLAIAAIPEEFPTVYTVYLTLGVWALSRERALVRRLASVETLGSTTVICADKTGTITEGVLAVQEAIPCSGASRGTSVRDGAG
jgi:Ca2+-transporting ATPase